MAYDTNKNGTGCTEAGTAGIELLLEKYFEGATSLEEEARLREFFTSGEPVPEHLRYAQALFGYFADASADTGKPAVHPAGGSPALNKRRGWKLLTVALSAAAVTALAVLLFNGRADRIVEGEVYCYIDGVPVTDPELALDYTAKAFQHISGTVREPVEEVSAVLGEQLSRLEILSVFVDMIENNE